MVAQNVAGPGTSRQDSLNGVNHLANVPGGVYGSKQPKIEGHVELIQGNAVVGCPLLPFKDGNFSDHETRMLKVNTAILLKETTQIAIHRMCIIMVAIIEMQLRIIFTQWLIRRPFGMRVGWIIAQRWIFENVMSTIDAKSIHTAIKPEPHDSEHGLFESRVTPIQIRLSLMKRMEVVLPRVRIPFPGRSSPMTEPIVGGRAIRFRISPDIPITIGMLSLGAGGEKPGMLIRGMIGNEIENHTQVASMSFHKQLIKEGKIPKKWIDPGMVGHIISSIDHE